MQYFQVQVGSKELLQQFGSGVRILHNYKIYFDQLLCFQEISMTESLGQNSVLNSTDKPDGLLIMIIKGLFMRNGTILTLHIIPNRKLNRKL